MSELAQVVADAFVTTYQEVRDAIHELTAPLSTKQFWMRPFPHGNSIGHLLLHLTGNLNHYIGAKVAGTGYIRNRPLEFSDASQRPKEQLLADFDAAIAMVIATIRKQRAEDWTAPYSAETPSKNRLAVFHRMAAHAQHHLGQIIYLAREVSKAPA